MSMISAQIDELRERAKELCNLAPDPDVPYLVPSTKETMALAMRSAASEMEEAADTIQQLRDDLQRANAENAKLHNNADLLRAMLSQVQTEKRCYMAENAKLRETLKVLMVGTNAELCANRGESDCKECFMYHGEDECVVVDAMELLGIDMYGDPLRVEVDG